MSTEVPTIVSGFINSSRNRAMSSGSDSQTEKTVVDLPGVRRHHLGETGPTTIERDMAARASLDQAALTEMPPRIGGEVVRATAARPAGD